jgi:hypothetical protein
LLFGHPTTAPDTVGAAVRVAGLVVKVRFPFLIASAGTAVSDVAGPASDSHSQSMLASASARR